MFRSQTKSSTSTDGSKLQTEQDVFWYLPENLDETQTNALAGFRDHLTTTGLLLQGHDDDITLLRFLKARKWTIKDATVMYQNMANWRKEQRINELYSSFDFPELDQLCSHYPHFYHKQDKFGRPVYIELVGKLNCSKMLEVAPQDRILQYHVWTWERLERQLMPACSSLAGRPIATCTVILDLAGVSLWHFGSTTRTLLKAISKIDQDYYPEHLGTMFIINTPYVFSSIWSWISPLLEERTRKKIVVLDSNYLDKVTQLIPLEQLPTMFGGKSECNSYTASEGPWTEVEPCLSSNWLPRPGQPKNSSLKMSSKGSACSPLDERLYSDVSNAMSFNTASNDSVQALADSIKVGMEVTSK